MRSTVSATRHPNSTMIRSCDDADVEAIYTIINDAAQAYRGIIPTDRWHEPYMPRQELRDEINAGVTFLGYEDAGTLIGVMGVQPVKGRHPDSTRLCAHRTAARRNWRGPASRMSGPHRPARPDRHLGCGGLGHQFLREARVRRHRWRREKPLTQNLLVNPGAADRNISRAGGPAVVSATLSSRWGTVPA